MEGEEEEGNRDGRKGGEKGRRELMKVGGGIGRGGGGGLVLH